MFPIEKINFSANKTINTRIINSLRRSGIDTFEVLILLELEKELDSFLEHKRGLGEQSIYFIKKAVRFVTSSLVWLYQADPLETYDKWRDSIWAGLI